MLRKTNHIALVLLLGLYFNSVPVALLSYSTFAEKIFAAHCVNPGKPSCHGMCQVVSIQNKAEKSGSSRVPQIQFAQIQPSILPTVYIPDLSKFGKGIVRYFITPSVRQGIITSPFHPPKISA
ncbi:MAG: hypothetical protein ACHQM6_02620 [Candidatus Kapaibacterium sp.]